MTVETKIQRIEIGGDLYLIGASGLEAPAEIYIDWLLNGDWDNPPDPMPELDEEDLFTIILLSKENGIEVVDKYMRLTSVEDRWYATGTGGLQAWAVLKAGCGIRKAMTTALEMDSSSGGGYDVVYLDGTEETETTLGS